MFNARRQRSKEPRSGNRPGDWYCHRCNTVIFASKDKCRKCLTRKPTSASPIWQKPTFVPAIVTINYMNDRKKEEAEKAEKKEKAEKAEKAEKKEKKEKAEKKRKERNAMYRKHNTRYGYNKDEVITQSFCVYRVM